MEENKLNDNQGNGNNKPKKLRKKRQKSDTKTYSRFIVDGIDKKSLKQQAESLKIKKIRKCKNKKNNFLITLKNSKRIKEVKSKTQASSVVNAKKGDNFREDEYSDHSASYMEMESVHQIQTKLQELQNQLEQNQVEQKRQVVEYEQRLLHIKQQHEKEQLAQKQFQESRFDELKKIQEQSQKEIKELKAKYQSITQPTLKDLTMNQLQILRNSPPCVETIKNQLSLLENQKYTATKLEQHVKCRSDEESAAIMELVLFFHEQIKAIQKIAGGGAGTTSFKTTPSTKQPFD